MAPSTRAFRVAILALACALSTGLLVWLPGDVWAQEPTARPTPTFAPEWTVTPTETMTPTITPTPTVTGTPTLTPTITPTFTPTPTMTGTPTLRPVTPISTLDRWYRGPAPVTQVWLGTVDGTPGILPVVGAVVEAPLQSVPAAVFAGLLVGGIGLLVGTARMHPHG